MLQHGLSGLLMRSVFLARTDYRIISGCKVAGQAPGWIHLGFFCFFKPKRKYPKVQLEESM